MSRDIYSTRTRVWIDRNDKPFLGMGRVKLLEEINNTGSISGAAKRMKMSYRQAWQLVKDMNEAAGRELVEKILGGKMGGGARLTPAGLRAITLFYGLETEITAFINKKSRDIRL